MFSGSDITTRTIRSLCDATMVLWIFQIQWSPYWILGFRFCRADSAKVPMSCWDSHWYFVGIMYTIRDTRYFKPISGLCRHLWFVTLTRSLIFTLHSNFIIPVVLTDPVGIVLLSRVDLQAEINVFEIWGRHLGFFHFRFLPAWSYDTASILIG